MSDSLPIEQARDIVAVFAELIDPATVFGCQEPVQLATCILADARRLADETDLAIVAVAQTLVRMADTDPLIGALCSPPEVDPMARARQESPQG